MSRELRIDLHAGSTGNWRAASRERWFWRPSYSNGVVRLTGGNQRQIGIRWLSLYASIWLRLCDRNTQP